MCLEGPFHDHGTRQHTGNNAAGRTWRQSRPSPCSVSCLAPAGTFAYWQAWAYMGVVLIPMLFVMTYMLRNAPELLARRLQMRERERTQKRVIGFSMIFLLGASSCPVSTGAGGGQHAVVGRCGRRPSGPARLRGSSFASSERTGTAPSRTVQVEQGQQIVSTGPYAVVRHPMYVGVLVFYLASPIALGSWWAFCRRRSAIPGPRHSHSERGAGARARLGRIPRVQAEDEVPAAAGDLVSRSLSATAVARRVLREHGPRFCLAGSVLSASLRTNPLPG